MMDLVGHITMVDLVEPHHTRLTQLSSQGAHAVHTALTVDTAHTQLTRRTRNISHGQVPMMDLVGPHHNGRCGKHVYHESIKVRRKLSCFSGVAGRQNSARTEQ